MKVKKWKECVYEIPVTIENVKILKTRLTKIYQYNETRWIDWHLVEAMKSYENVISNRLVYLFNQVTESVLSDDELVERVRIF